MQSQRISDRQRVRLVLTDLMEANLAHQIAKRERAADGRPETVERFETSRAAAVRLQAEAKRLVAAIGTRKDRDRLAALLSLRWIWLVALMPPL